MAKRENLKVVEWIEELDPGGGDATREGWNRAIGMVESREVAGLAVWALNRFSRSVKDALNALQRIEGAGVLPRPARVLEEHTRLLRLPLETIASKPASASSTSACSSRMRPRARCAKGR